MGKHLTIAYLTSRKDPKIEWFLDSLKAQSVLDRNLSIIAIDFHCTGAKPMIHLNGLIPICYTAYPVKPTVWQGEHRLTKDNWFAASNARNTALCLAKDGYLAYVDDLSILCPGWLDRVKVAMQENYIVLGSYEKVRKMEVENGMLKFCEHFPEGKDSRLTHLTDDSPKNVDGGWLYGCSLAGPVESFLSVNGWPEFVDGLSSEDYCMGLALQNAGHRLVFDPNMKTIESEELHFAEPPMKRMDKGVSPRDKSHAALNIAKQSKWFPNYFGPEGIRGLREKVLAGESFPIMKIPEADWYDGQLLSEM